MRTMKNRLSSTVGGELGSLAGLWDFEDRHSNRIRYFFPNRSLWDFVGGDS